MLPLCTQRCTYLPNSRVSDGQCTFHPLDTQTRSSRTTSRTGWATWRTLKKMIQISLRRRRIARCDTQRPAAEAGWTGVQSCTWAPRPSGSTAALLCAAGGHRIMALATVLTSCSSTFEPGGTTVMVAYWHNGEQRH